MAVPLYGVEANSGQIITLDDEAVVKDQTNAAGVGGNTFTPFIVSTIFDQGLDGGYSTIRRAVQHVHADGGVTVDITSYHDEQASGTSIQRVLATGANPVVVAPLFASGTNFQVKAVLSAFDAAVELGTAQQYIVPRRTVR